MSIYVLREVLEHSRAEHGARLVAIALAEGASKEEGITWISQEEIGRLTLLGESAVRDGLTWLEANCEIEIRKAQRGRRRINVYRVVVGRYATVEAFGDDLPFELSAPFSRPSEITGRRLALLAERMESEPTAETQGRPSKITGRNGAMDNAGRPSESASDDPRNPGRRPSESAVFGGPSKEGPVNEPEREPSAEPAAAAHWLEQKLERGMRRLGVGAQVRALALTDVERSLAWLDVVRVDARDNPAGMFAQGVREGEWPSGRGPERAQAVRAHLGKEATLRNHVANGFVDLARDLIDEEWENLTPIERADFHLLVDELVSAQLPEAPAAPARARGAA